MKGEPPKFVHSFDFGRGIRSSQDCGFLPCRVLARWPLQGFLSCKHVHFCALGSHPLCYLLAYMCETGYESKQWFSMGSFHIWFVYCGELGLHLSDLVDSPWEVFTFDLCCCSKLSLHLSGLVAETIDRDATRDWAFGAYVLETNLQRKCLNSLQLICQQIKHQNLFDSYWTKSDQLI